MTLKTILLCLTSPENTKVLLKAAVPLAERTGAHLIGLHAVEALQVYPTVAMHLPSTFYADFSASQASQANEIKEIFSSATKGTAFVSEWRLLTEDTTFAHHRTIESARASDLVMMVQPTKDAPEAHRDGVTEMIRTSGRPVLVIPPGYDGRAIGANLVLGWSATREATRAAHDMLLLAAPGAAVSVLTVTKSGQDPLHDTSAIDITEALSRHGLKAEIVQRDPTGDSVASVIQHEAFARGSDVIVTGAFGHSRGYDLIIGAATRDLLAHASLPVLYAK